MQLDILKLMKQKIIKKNVIKLMFRQQNNWLVGHIKIIVFLNIEIGEDLSGAGFSLFIDDPHPEMMALMKKISSVRFNQSP